MQKLSTKQPEIRINGDWKSNILLLRCRISDENKCYESSLRIVFKSNLVSVRTLRTI